LLVGLIGIPSPVAGRGGGGIGAGVSPFGVVVVMGGMWLVAERMLVRCPFVRLVGEPLAFLPPIGAGGAK